MSLKLEAYLPQLHKLFAEHDVILAYIFGSQAEGTAGPLSDVDFAVLLAPSVPDEQQTNVQIELITELMGLFHRNDVDVVILNRATPLLAYQVVKPGWVIYEDDGGRSRVAFETSAFHRYMDTVPLRRIQHRYFGKRVETRRTRQTQGQIIQGGHMIDTDVVIERLEALEEYMDRLRPFQDRSIDDLAKEEPITYWGVLHGLQLCAQCVIDVSTHIQAALALERVADYQGVILALGRHGVIPQEFAGRIQKLPSFRNILVHEYLRVDPQLVQQNIRHGLDDFEAFMDHIYDFLCHEGYLNRR